MKKILSLFLIALMIFTSLPVVYATDSGNATVEDETSISAENGLSKIIENLSETEDEYANTGYSISDMTFDGATANVTVNVPDECTLVVAVYDEDTFEMISSATKKLTASVYSEDYRKDIISLDIELSEMPEHFLAKSFILDENNNALCKNYTCRTYTTAFEIFMETTPADFEGKEIITMDDNCDDFGVLVDGAVTATKSDTMSYTYYNGVYTFYNAVDEVKNLKPDDIFYYQLSDEIGDFLLIKVASVDVDSSTVTIVEDDDIALGDAFQFVRIDADADFSEFELTEDDLGSALSFQEPEMQASVMSARSEIVVETTGSYSTSFNIKYPQDDSKNKDHVSKDLEVSGNCKYTISAGANLYYDVRSGFYEFKVDLTHSVSLYATFSGEFGLNKDVFKASFKDIPIGSIFTLDVTIYPIVSAKVDVTFGGTLEVYNKISCTDANGLTKINDTKWFDPTADLAKTEVEVSIGLGIEFDLGFKKGKKDEDGMSKIHLSATASIEAVVKAIFVPSLVGNLFNKHHNCVFCLEGSLSVFVGGKATLKIKIVSNSLKFQWDAIDLSASADLGDIYFSMGSNGVKLGFGVCPNISHKVTVTVYNSESGKPVLGAVVSTTTGYCDADGDEEFKENSMITDEKGQVVFYFPKGEHEIIAKKDGIGTGGHKFEMLANEKEINLELFDAEYFDGHYYKVYTKPMLWLEAKDYCESIGGHLATITSEAENALIMSIVGNHYCFLGGTDMYLEGDWSWVTGEPWNYQNWNDGEPNDGLGLNGGQDYLAMYGNYNKDGIVGKWDDGWDEALYFVCEWETIPTDYQIKSYRIALRNIYEETTNETIINGTTASRADALKGAEYVAVAVKDESAEDLFANDNLIYIDQKTAESSVVSFDVVIPEGVDNYTIKIFGVSHIHTPDEAVVENETKATCTESGSYDMVTYCSVCGEELSREIVITDMLEHTNSDWIIDKESTCSAEGSKHIECTVCEAIIKAESISKISHEYKSVVTEATCTNNGLITYTCDCGDTYTETIPATGHTFDGSKCTSCGYDKADECDCNCHASGIKKFFFNFILFFQKLFKKNAVCACGVAHY